MMRGKLQFYPTTCVYLQLCFGKIYDYALITYTQLQFGNWGEIIILPLHV